VAGPLTRCPLVTAKQAGILDIPAAAPPKRDTSGPTLQPRRAVQALKLLDHYRGIVQCDGHASLEDDCQPRMQRSDHSRLLLGPPAQSRVRYCPRAAPHRSPVRLWSASRPSMRTEKTIRGKSADASRTMQQERSKPWCWRSKPGWRKLACVAAKATIAEDIRP
jgi:transposase